MYEAYGINLSKSQYDAIRTIESGTLPDDSIIIWELEQLGLAKTITASSNTESDLVVNASLSTKGKDWITSFEHSDNTMKSSRRREWRIIVVTALLTATLSCIGNVMLHIFGVA